MLNEIEKTIVYEDKNIIISKNYISDPKDIGRIVKCSDVLGIHKLVHKTNYVIDYYKIIITDKYGRETGYTYKSNQEEICNEIISLLASKCKNAELGYNKDEWDHINNNRIPLNDISKEMNYEYKCPECKNNIDYGDKFCKNCSCKLDWNDDSEEEFIAKFKTLEEKQREKIQDIGKQKQKSKFWIYIVIIFLSILSSETLLMIITDDDIEGTLALTLLVIVSIPFLFLYRYWFIVKKELTSTKTTKNFKVVFYVFKFIEIFFLANIVQILFLFLK